jgi:hypothetical protein
VLGYG